MTLDEADETFTIALSSQPMQLLQLQPALVTITDNDPAPTISINDVSTSNENAASTNLVATLSAASGKAITVDFATSNGTATAGSDYTASSDTYICSWDNN